MNTPPEGRATRNSKPKIPAPAPRPTQPGDLAPSEPTRMEVVRGVGVARRVLYRAEVGTESWATNMLLAVASAKALGFTMFELDVIGVPSRGKNKPVSAFTSLFGSPMIETEDWQNNSGSSGNGCAVVVYAVVVE